MLKLYSDHSLKLEVQYTPGLSLIHIFRFELTIGDLAVSLDALLEDAVGDGSISFDALLEGAACDACLLYTSRCV